jgi:hypothetical protein
MEKAVKIAGASEREIDVEKGGTIKRERLYK